jgi:antirestriction protein ArdC
MTPSLEPWIQDVSPVNPAISETSGMRTAVDPIESCETLLKQFRYIPPIEEHDDLVQYGQSKDTIYMLRKDRFLTQEYYYCTLFHEIVHSTGHENRLCRVELYENGGQDTPRYCLEELTAEFGAAYLCALASIENKMLAQNITYINIYFEKLNNDLKLVKIAMIKAQAAIDYLLVTGNKTDPVTG